jgi:hypothetical protein
MAKKKVSPGVAMAALRMTKMTPQQRSKVARHAVNVRWAMYRAKKAVERKKINALVRARKAA